MPKTRADGQATVAGAEPEHAAGGTQREPEPPEAPPAGTEPGDDYDGLLVPQLRERLHQRDLPVSGTRPELVARLRADDAERGLIG